MQKLVIGCGYLGQRVARAWRDAGHPVAALTRSEHNAEQFRQWGLEPIVGDVLDPGSLASLPEAETALYAVGYDRSTGKSQREIYVKGLENVLQAVSGRIGRLIYVSSTSVYGQSTGEWIDETSPREPTRANGQACLEAEQVVWRFFPPEEATPEHGAVVLRLAGIYGPGRLLRRLDQLRTGDPISGNPDAYLNLIHVDDAVRAILACEGHGRKGATYLVCDDKPITRRDYYERLASLSGAPRPAFETDSADNANRGESLNKRCSNRRLREELGVELRFPSIESGLPHALGET